MKRVLFVDVRNATRSQIAEAWFNHLAGRKARAKSCGTVPADRIGVNAVEVMLELGIDISRRAPHPINQRMLDQADIVVLLGTGIYPRSHADVRVWKMEDLSGKPIDQVRQMRDLLCRRVEQLVVEIGRERVVSASLDWNLFLPKRLQEVWN